MKISKIFLYDEPSVPELQMENLSKFIEKNFSIPVEIRKNIFNFSKENTAEKISSCRINDLTKPFKLHIPSEEEIIFESDSDYQDSDKEALHFISRMN